MRRPPWRCKCHPFLCMALGMAWSGLYSWNHSFVLSQQEAPLDHIYVTIQKPWQTCIPATVMKTTTPPDNLASIEVPFYMISARPRGQVQPILKTWQASFQIELVATHNVSSTYRNTKCLELTFKSRLFAVYQHILAWALRMNPDASHFVIIEDDTRLLDGLGLLDELQWAVGQNLDYYSFHSTNSKSCLYEWGTQAQVFSRLLMRRILDVDDTTFCRLPIDMYIAQQGPWYVTQRPLVQHVGKRLQKVVSSGTRRYC